MAILDKKTMIAAANKAAAGGEREFFLEREIGDRLMDKLEFMQLKPEVILNMGVRTEHLSRQLSARYPQAQVITVDWAEKALRRFSSFPSVCAEPEMLPLQPQTVDLIVAYLANYDGSRFKEYFQEWRRLLKPGGLLLLSALGPDTLYELRESFAAVDTNPRVHPFVDMHNVGDMLAAARFAEPVMEAEHLCLTYSRLSSLWRDLKRAGATNALHTRTRGLQGKNRWKKMLAHYERFMTPEGAFPATLEIIYGIGWVADKVLHDADEQGNIVIPVNHLRRK